MLTVGCKLAELSGVGKVAKRKCAELGADVSLPLVQQYLFRILNVPPLLELPGILVLRLLARDLRLWGQVGSSQAFLSGFPMGWEAREPTRSIQVCLSITCLKGGHTCELNSAAEPLIPSKYGPLAVLSLEQ